MSCAPRERIYAQNSLQQTGFTASVRYRTQLRALTPLFSSLPINRRYCFCGTFPRLYARPPLAAVIPYAARTFLPRAEAGGD